MKEKNSKKQDSPDEAQQLYAERYTTTQDATGRFPSRTSQLLDGIEGVRIAPGDAEIIRPVIESVFSDFSKPFTSEGQSERLRGLQAAIEESYDKDEFLQLSSIPDAQRTSAQKDSFERLAELREALVLIEQLEKIRGAYSEAGATTYPAPIENKLLAIDQAINTSIRLGITLVLTGIVPYPDAESGQEHRIKSGYSRWGDPVNQALDEHLKRFATETATALHNGKPLPPVNKTAAKIHTALREIGEIKEIPGEDGIKKRLAEIRKSILPKYLRQ